MKPIILFSTITLLLAATAPLGLAKDKKKDKDRDHDNRDHDNDRRVVYVERDGRRYYNDSDGRRHWITQDRNDYRNEYDRNAYHGNNYNGNAYYGNDGYVRDRTRTVYVIERNRPVQRVVYVNSSGKYYQIVNGRRVYVSQRVYTSYPANSYYRDGRPRLNITIPF